MPHALPLKMTELKTKTRSFLKKCLFHRNYAFTKRFDSYTFTKKPRLHFAESFTLKQIIQQLVQATERDGCGLIEPMELNLYIYHKLP